MYPNNNSLRIIGIDPGSHRAGYAVLEKKASKIKILNYGTVEVPPRTPSPDNLVILRKGLKEILEEFNPSIASVEEMFFAKNKKTASRVFESRGVLLVTLAEMNIQVLEPTVSQIKKGTTGSGTADKKQIRQALKLLLNVDLLKGHDDSWDAIAAAYVGLSMTSSPLLSKLR
ncbi:crossover junction endodeoxyribonuclease RuvC [Leptospira noguchii]|uniref:Crossover junction endodeoxyribonuclease RuvC n=2 Tax=Leptospira noguchii TaxID=28182 RepID=M6UIZ8_9LEPT|nr:crossover junction endodeoxyribonuclease RuvC [Leptospira noguchii]EKR74671.1 putative crossover junction endodeoxyribonuclease RuvC [Leptospira noguchii str. 2006001870]EMO42801.1 putative crossover junction endodeoxyribonuclease RuvC [Leptospira noguchii serovar Autumnalis str. ZUN142]EMS85381.1 putative crossover junction endodeoxyribonuclease RuvC [Leptospira noguchii str. Cascata]TQE67538.1 crossover junction endodeoxyribonuclease RuvC [Leptospira noguchii]UOG29914.1 crossover junction